MAGADGRLWFDESGALNLSERLPAETLLAELLKRLRLFLARMESCERAPNGDYKLSGSRSGSMGGARVLWEDVFLIAAALQGSFIPPLTPEEIAALQRDGVYGFDRGPVKFPRNALPLVDVLHSLSFAILFNETENWKGSIPASRITQLFAIEKELNIHLQSRINLPLPPLDPAPSRTEPTPSPTSVEPEATPPTRAASKLPKLQPHDMQAWQLWRLAGKSQQDAAEILNREFGTTYRQSQISKMVKRAQAYLDAGGLADALRHATEKGTKPQAMDPDSIDMGKRQDGTKPRRREDE